MSEKLKSVFVTGTVLKGLKRLFSADVVYASQAAPIKARATANLTRYSNFAVSLKSNVARF